MKRGEEKKCEERETERERRKKGEKEGIVASTRQVSDSATLRLTRAPTAAGGFWWLSRRPTTARPLRVATANQHKDGGLTRGTTQKRRHEELMNRENKEQDDNTRRKRGAKAWENSGGLIRRIFLCKSVDCNLFVTVNIFIL